MGKVLEYNTNAGINLPESYWKVGHIHYDAINRSVRVHFLAFKDIDASDANKAAIDAKIYDFSGDGFLDFQAKVVQNQEVNPIEWAYNKAVEVKDISRTVTQKDAEGKDVQVTVNTSFFETARDV